MKLYPAEKIAIGLAIGFFVVLPILYMGVLFWLGF
jgi:hypothetical protein